MSLPNGTSARTATLHGSIVDRRGDEGFGLPKSCTRYELCIFVHYSVIATIAIQKKKSTTIFRPIGGAAIIEIESSTR
jgi:hypothetical protein